MRREFRPGVWSTRAKGGLVGPLKGTKVVEMAGLAPGPFAAMMLADMGAQVLRIERPGQKAPPGHPKVALLERGRRCVSLDLKSAAGSEVMRRLLSQSGAFIEGFRPGVMERLGFGPEPCLKLNPRLVYGRMTGWGQDGPLAKAARSRHQLYRADRRAAVDRPAGREAERSFEDGFLYVADRVGDIIVTGGENVYLIEVEQALFQHPAIREAAVIGVPSEQWGESLHGVIVLDEGHRRRPTNSPRTAGS